MVKRPALVNLVMWELLQIVDQNAQLTLIVQLLKLVFAKSVEILVLVLVVIMRIVESFPIVLNVCVFLDTLEIRFLVVIPYHLHHLKLFLKKSLIHAIHHHVELTLVNNNIS